jgi:hypothetical protein
MNIYKLTERYVQFFGQKLVKSIKKRIDSISKLVYIVVYCFRHENIVKQPV